MNTGYVFDTEAIIAFLYNEPGHDTVASLLEEVHSGERVGRLAEINASEVYYLVARFEGVDDSPTPTSIRVADRDLRALERQGVHIESVDWRLAAEVKTDGGLSLADAYAVALAHDRNATLVIGDDGDFEDLPVDVAITRFRA